MNACESSFVTHFGERKIGYCFFEIYQDTIFFSVLLLVVAISFFCQAKHIGKLLKQLNDHNVNEETALLSVQILPDHGSITGKPSQSFASVYQKGLTCNASLHTVIGIPMLWLIWIASVNYLFKE